MFDTTAILIELLTFALIVAVSLIVARIAASHAQVNRRLQGAVTPSKSDASVVKSRTLTNPFLHWVQSAVSMKDFTDRGRLSHTLSLAGFNSPAAPIIYVLVRFGLAIGLPVMLLVEQTLFAKVASGLGLVAASLLLCGLGLIAPYLYVDSRLHARVAQLEHEFPDALDLMVVCVEAGLGLDAAFVRVGQEVKETHPRIAEEFGRLAQELAAGRSRADALHALADRSGVDTIKSFVALLVQTETLGVSISQTLRTYSDEMRETRFMKAEEKAMRIPVLMTLPLVACILPVIITVLLLPAAIDVIRTVGPALTGNH